MALITFTTLSGNCSCHCSTLSDTSSFDGTPLYVVSSFTTKLLFPCRSTAHMITSSRINFHDWSVHCMTSSPWSATVDTRCFLVSVQQRQIRSFVPAGPITALWSCCLITQAAHYAQSPCAYCISHTVVNKHARSFFRVCHNLDEFWWRLTKQTMLLFIICRSTLSVTSTWPHLAEM